MVVVGAVAVAAAAGLAWATLGDGDMSLRGSGEPRDDDIREVTDGLWAAAGVPSDQVTVNAYNRESKGDTVGCADLPAEDDRWVASRTSRVAGELYPQMDLFDGATAYLKDHGFEVKRYRDPVSGYLELRAEGDEMVVFFNVERNGAAHARVVAGPCATFMHREPPTLSDPIP